MKKNEVDLKAMFDSMHESLSEADRNGIDAGVLALKFIGLVDEAMEEQGVSKKELAERIGTSASFVTQVFRGNRKPSWEFLAKAQRAMNLRFEISTKEKLNDWLADEIIEYHARWARNRSALGQKDSLPPLSLLTIDEQTDYALAG